MKKTLVLVLAGIFCLSSNIFAKSIDQLPMYGNKPKTDAQKKADEEFIQLVQKEMSLSKGAEHQVKRGWEAFYDRDNATAMKRFNQAWLLNPNNADIYWGFGDVLGSENKF